MPANPNEFPDDTPSVPRRTRAATPTPPSTSKPPYYNTSHLLFSISVLLVCVTAVFVSLFMIHDPWEDYAIALQIRDSEVDRSTRMENLIPFSERSESDKQAIAEQGHLTESAHQRVETVRKRLPKVQPTDPAVRQFGRFAK